MEKNTRLIPIGIDDLKESINKTISMIDKVNEKMTDFILKNQS